MAGSFVGGGGNVVLGPNRQASQRRPPRPARASYADALSFSNLGAASPGTPTVYNTPVRPMPEQKAANIYYPALQGGPQPETAGNLGSLMGGNSAGGGRAGGGSGGPDLAAIQAQADQLFAFNAAPYDQMRQGIETQYQFNPQPYEAMVGQAQGYNPDFAGMEAQARGSIEGAGAQMQAQIAQRLEALKQRVAGMGQTYSDQMRGAVRDLAGQGINTDAYYNQAGQMGADVAAGGAGMVGLGGQMEVLGLQNQQNALQALPSVRMGGEATLANNRGQLLNQIATERAKQELALNQARAQALGQLGIQQAQAQQQNDLARREFLLRYGVTS